MDWIYQGKTLTEPPEGATGMVYLLTYVPNNRMYVGKKLFWSKRTLKPLKGKTRRRVKYVESDWRTYMGSCQEILDIVSEEGINNFHREVLHICEGRGILAYAELKEQVYRNALVSDEYFNGIIQCRIGHKSVKGLK